MHRRLAAPGASQPRCFDAHSSCWRGTCFAACPIGAAISAATGRHRLPRAKGNGNVQDCGGEDHGVLRDARNFRDARSAARAGVRARRRGDAPVGVRAGVLHARDRDSAGACALVAAEHPVRHHGRRRHRPDAGVRLRRRRRRRARRTSTRIADAGIRFRNTWSMPACSTSRAVIFNGRFPLRTNVYGALGPDDLANSMVSPYRDDGAEAARSSAATRARCSASSTSACRATTRSAYAHAARRSAGTTSPAGSTRPATRRRSTRRPAAWPTAGATYSCGFVPGAAARRRRLRRLLRGRRHLPAMPTGRRRSRPAAPAAIAAASSIRASRASAARRRTSTSTTLSGHYVSPLVINHEDGRVEQVPPTDSARAPSAAPSPVDAAIDWIKRPAAEPAVDGDGQLRVGAHAGDAAAAGAAARPAPAATSGLDCGNANGSSAC